MIFLDTNTLIRLFTNDEPQKVKKIENLLKKESDVHVSDVVFPEIEYILIKKYQQSRQQIIPLFKFLSSHSAIQLSNYAKQAILLYERTKLDMADCFIATQSYGSELASFDKELLNTSNVTPYWNKQLHK